MKLLLLKKYFLNSKMPFRILFLWCILMTGFFRQAAAQCQPGDNTGPTQNNCYTHHNCWELNGSNIYYITIVATDPSGFGSTYGMLALINYQGNRAGNYGGYYAWNKTKAQLDAIGYTKDQMQINDGWIGMYAFGYGQNAATLVNGSSSVSGNQRTVTFHILPSVSNFPAFADNDISFFCQDECGNFTGWTNYDVNFASIYSHPTPGTINVNGSTSGVVNVYVGQTISVTQSGWNNLGGVTYFYADNTDVVGGWSVPPYWEIIDYGVINPANQVNGQNNVNNLTTFNFKINNVGLHILHTNAYSSNGCYTYTGGVNRYINTVSVTAGAVALSSAAICDGSAITINSTTNATISGASDLTFQWWRESPPTSNNWSLRATNTSQTFSENPPPGKHRYLRRAYSASIGACVHQCFDAITGTLTVDYTPSIPPIVGNNVLCKDQQVTFSLSSQPSGGSVSTSGGYRIHSYTSVGSHTFTTPSAWNAEVLVVAGGGGGGGVIGGGGGAGGLLYQHNFSTPAGSNTVVVGGGGTGGTGWDTPGQQGGKGGNSQFASLTAEGGGGGGIHGGASAPQTSAWNGGSGGGGGTGSGGTGIAGQGKNGGAGGGNNGGGGGGANFSNNSGLGGNSSGNQTCCTGGISAGNGGNGIQLDITGSLVWYAGGGGGGTRNGNGTAGTGGLGGGGNGTTSTTLAGHGAANTGGGGGGGGYSSPTTAQVGGNGGSGIVVVRYPNVTGGTWSSSNTSIATVNSSGVVTAQGVGNTNINYTFTSPAGCSNTISRQIIVTQIPAVPVVANNSPVCESGTLELTAAGLAPGGGGSNSNGAYSFNGTNQYFYTDNISGFPTGSVATVEAWVKPGSSQNDATYNGIVSFGPNPATCHNRFLLSMSNDRRITFANWCNDYTANTEQLPANQWSHVAVVLNGTGTNNLSIYYNGNLVARGTTTAAGSTNMLDNGRLTIGCTDPGGGRYFNGQIDNVRIWNTARTQNEIIADMYKEVATSNTSGLVAHFNFNNNINCQNNSNYNLTAVNNAASVYPGLYTYQWTGTGAPAASTNEIQTTTNAATGNYTVIAHMAGFCHSPASANTPVTVNPKATVTPGNIINVCQSPNPSPVTLTGASFGGAATIAIWNIESGGGSLNNVLPTTQPDTVKYTPAANFTGTVILRLTTNDPDGSGPCDVATDTRTIIVNPLPTVNVGPAMSDICQGATSAALGGSVGGGATGGTWNDGGVNGTFNPNANNLNATWTPPASYYGTVTFTLTTSGGLCGNISDSKQMVVNPNPVITAHPQPLIRCQGTTGSFSITATGADYYQWQYYDGSNWVNISDVVGEIEGSDASMMQILSANIFYNNKQIRCVASTVHGCFTNSNSALFTVHPPSNAGSISGAPADICSGGTITYTTSGITGTFTRYEYQWNGTGGSWSTLHTSNPYTWTSGNPGNTIYVRAMVTSGTCPPAYSAPVSTFIKYPTPAQPGPITLNGLQCTGTQGYSISAVANATNYTWSVNGTANIISGQGTTAINIQYANAGSYTISVTASNSCGTSPVRTLSQNIAETRTPTISIVSDIIPYNVCDGTQLTFTGTPFHQGSSPVYQWKKNGVNVGTNSLTYITNTLQPGDVIMLQMTSSETCVTTATVNSNFIDVVCKMICVGFNTGYATFNAGSGGLSGSSDQYQVSINNGATWSAYTPGHPINTNGGIGSVKVRARRVAPGNNCNSDWNVYTLWNFWPPTVAPVLDTVMPDQAQICETMNWGDAGFTPGSGGPLDAEDEYEVNINDGSGWTSYTLGSGISLLGGSGTVKIRGIRTGGSDGCVQDTNQYNLWSIVSPTNGIHFSADSGDYIWTGADGLLWGNARNFIWFDGTRFRTPTGLPTANNNVLIPDSIHTVCYPNNTATLNVTGNTKNITIEPDASLTVNGSNTLNVNGNWVSEGTFTPATGTVNFTGSGNGDKTIASFGNKFYRVNVAKGGNEKVTISDNFESLNKTTVISGSLEVPANRVAKVKQAEVEIEAEIEIKSSGQLKVNE